MTVFLIIIILSLLIVCGYLIHNRIETIGLNNSTISRNKILRSESERLTLEHEQLLFEQAEADIKLKELQTSIEQQTNVLNSLNETAKDLTISAQQRADEIYQSKLKENEDKLGESYRVIALDYANKLSDLDMKILASREKLEDLEAKQLAYIKAQQRQEEIEQKQDYYRLVISDDDKSDIQLLRDLQKHLIKKESVDKVIYETYYKPAYDILMSHLFKDNKEKVCGIYKITDLITGLAYIGQSVDIRERWRTHIKTALSCGKATNKLYQQMQKSGQDNFTFEILEEVSRDKLNEREIYWIDFYKTKDFGLNKTAGGS